MECLNRKNRLLSLSASAGSGKTFALVVRYLSLLFAGANPKDILAITFTNKAANEMEERVVSALENLDESMAIEISKKCGVDIEQILDRREAVLERFLSADIAIMTIDSFINKILAKFCWFVGMTPDYSVKDIDRELIFEHFLKSLSDIEYLQLIESAKFESKKSSSILEFFHLLYIMDKELPYINTQRELPRYDASKILTIARKISEYFLSQKISKPAQKSMKFESIEELLKRTWVWKETLEYWHYKKVWIPQMDDYLKELQREIYSYYRYREESFLAQIFNLYDKYRRSRESEIFSEQSLYFIDIEHFVYDLINRSEMMDFIKFRLDSRFNHILFDEFQDTSVTQYKIFEPFIEEISSSIDLDRSFFYVGDTKQSIYRFRGGRKELFDFVGDRFRVNRENLAKNYRSAKEIVDFVNETFDYINPKQEATKEGGFVQVIKTQADSMLNRLKEVIEELHSHNIPDEEIAILVHDNKDILKLSEFIENEIGSQVNTHKRAMVKSQRGAKILIEAMRLIYSQIESINGDIHRLNLLSLLGREYDESFRIDMDITRPAKMLKELMDRFQIYEESAMKLLEFAIPLDSIEDFLYEIESYEEELPSHSNSGINLLTIHKSKGLEFEHLIVMDRFSRGANDNSPLIFEYDGIDIKRVWMRLGNREVVDSEYAKALSIEKRLSAEDRKNRNYVAFTRAKESLSIIAREGKDGKEDKISSFNDLNLSEMRRGELKVKDTLTPKEISREKVEIEIVDYGRQGVRGDEDDSYNPNDIPAIYLGKAVHYLFETDSKDASLNRYGFFTDMDMVCKLADDGKNNSEYLKLCVGEMNHEVPFIKGGKVGVIDLLIKDKNRRIIIDYKSATPSDKSEYISQVKRYIRAVKRFEKGVEVEGYIYFLDRLEIYRVEG